MFNTMKENNFVVIYQTKTGTETLEFKSVKTKYAEIISDALLKLPQGARLQSVFINNEKYSCNSNKKAV